MKGFLGINMAAALLLCAAAPALAQGSGRFLTGPLGWTPMISIRDAGFDSNILDLPTDPKEDRVGTLAGTLDAQLTLAHFRVIGAANVEYAYFRRHKNERFYSRRFNLRAEAPTQRIVPNGTASYERAKDRSGPEVEGRVLRTVTTVGGGASVLAMSRGVIQLSARRERTAFDAGQVARGVNLSQRLNRDSDTAGLGVRINITDLTSLSFDGTVTRDRFNLSPDQNTHNLAWTAGIDFAPDAVIRGRAGFGYHIMESRSPGAISFEGFTANVDLTYLLYDRTRFTGRYFRDTTYSIEAPFFVATQYGLDITQLIGGPFELLVRGNRQRSEYPANVTLQSPARTDLIDTIAGGLGIRMSDTARATITYELIRRQSLLEALQYDRRRIITSISYGF